MNHPKPGLRDWWRASRLLAYLALRPQDVVPYLRYSLPGRCTPLNLHRPWWSFGAVRAVERLLRPDMRVFEYGSGGSSIYFAERVASITSVEELEEWATLVSEAAAKSRITNLSVLHRPFDFWQADDFASSGYLNALSGGPYDVIIIDGTEWESNVRETCFERAESFVKPGGFIILDDSFRYPRLKRDNTSKRWSEYRGAGYCRRGVTSTCIFEY